MKPLYKNAFSLAVITIITVTTTFSARAVTYNVNRILSGSDSLTGTVDVPVGVYNIMNAGASPFTSVDLTLTVNGSSFSLDHANTELIFGTGEFLINATSSTLTFDTANANGSNPADLQFYDNGNANRYALGWNGHPGFEFGYTSAGSSGGSATFPMVFGTANTAVPEVASTFGLLGLSLLGICAARRKTDQ